MLVAQITDTHITIPGALVYGVVDTAKNLERAVAALNGLSTAPDVTVITGDLVEGGEPEEYAHLRALLSPLRMPVLAIPGNHDAREPMRGAFGADGYLPRQGFLSYVIEDHPLRIVALDTLVPGEVGGALCAERLLWLDRVLAATDRPTLVLMHHPPLHRPIESRFAGTVAGTAPSTAHQIVLDLRPEALLSFAFEPPGYQLHYWREGASLVTHTVAIGDWPGPYYFHKEAPTV